MSINGEASKLLNLLNLYIVYNDTTVQAQINLLAKLPRPSAPS